MVGSHAGGRPTPAVRCGQGRPPTLPHVSSENVPAVSRRLRDLCEPIAGSVYFAPEAFDAYKQLGLSGYAEGYFTSRGACLGTPSGQVVCAAFGVFNPDVVIPSVEAGWSKTDP